MAYHQLKSDDLYVSGGLTKKDWPIRPCRQIIGQDRALSALNFGIQIKDNRAHLFCMGPKGVGRTSLTLDIVRQYAATCPTPQDWIYVMNFNQSQCPMALSLKPGQAPQFARQMEKLKNDLKKELKAAFKSEDYRLHFNQIEQQLQNEKQKHLDQLAEQINTENVALVKTTDGLGLNPVVGGQILNATAFNMLPLSTRAPVMQQMEMARQKLVALVKTLPDDDGQNQMEDLIKQTLNQVAEHCFKSVIQKYQKTDVEAFLKQAKNYFTQNASLFANNPSDEAWSFLDINVLTTHPADAGAPVIHLNELTFSGLFGKIERQQKSGTLSTDHTMIQAGALHLANGGFLVIEAKGIPSDQITWQALKQALFNRQIHMDTPFEEKNLISSRSLLPMDIPLNVKVILVGNANLYYDLAAKEEDFTSLFKLPVRFDESVPRTQENEKLYAGILTDFVLQNHLKPLTLGAINSLLGFAAYIAQNQKLLTTHFTQLHDLIREADFWAKGKTIDESDIKTALNKRHLRANTLQQSWMDDFKKKTIQLDLTGLLVGQINALTVNGGQDFAFGHPAKITCRARLGSGKIEDIENQINAGGKIHSKGVLILAAYSMGQYGHQEPFCWDASLVWEQLYHGVEGDSASLAQLCVLISAIANIPLKQSIAVTGAINQMGQVQSVGSVNLKVEGFFDACQANKLTGNQGVIIPAVCAQDLMLNERVREAVKLNQFHIYTVETVDDALEILTGLKANIIHKKMENAWHSAYLKMHSQKLITQ